MANLCPIDTEFELEIAILLSPPTSEQIQAYYDELLRQRKCWGIRVNYNAEIGKGVYACSPIGENELILKDPITVGAQHSYNKMDCLVCNFCFRFIGSVELQIGRKQYFKELSDLIAADCKSKEDLCCSNGYSKNGTTPEGLAKSLIGGDLKLPYSKRFPLPPVISCLGGCQEAYYCSETCAKLDWEMFHALLCVGGKSGKAMEDFTRHANETNDIFIVAAKVISCVILRYRRLKDDRSGRKGIGRMSLLLEAWKPFHMGHKRRWWECVAVPSDVDDAPLFRSQIRHLAFTSLELLKAAMFDDECAPLFSLELYGHIIGMFELNNLELLVPSPLQDYFMYAHGHRLPGGDEETLLHALGDDGYSVSCQGTAFYSIQSCMNHSCCPNAKAFKREQDRDGEAVIVSVRPISQGEEITISYIEEELPYEERKLLLADYGFTCSCPKCGQPCI